MEKKSIIILTILSILFFYGLTNKKKDVSINLHDSQSELCSSQLGTKGIYLSISEKPNYIDKKSDMNLVIKHRNKYFSDIISSIGGYAKSWKGIIKGITVIEEGVVLRISLLCAKYGDYIDHYSDIAILLMNPATTDLIKNNSEVYNKLRKYKEGDLVSFSGYFIGNGSENFEEGSLTKDGSMDYPELYFRFDSIEDIQ